VGHVDWTQDAHLVEQGVDKDALEDDEDEVCCIGTGELSYGLGKLHWDAGKHKHQAQRRSIDLS